MRCSGLTQRSLPCPQVMDLGQGKLRTVCSTSSAMISVAGRPADWIRPNHRPSRSTRLSLVRPVLRRNPSIAWSGAPTLGPFSSSSRSAWASGRPSTTRDRRRGPAKAFMPSLIRPAADRPSRIMRSRSRAAWACMRAGISSEKSSSSSWGMTGLTGRLGKGLEWRQSCRLLLLFKPG